MPNWTEETKRKIEKELEEMSKESEEDKAKRLEELGRITEALKQPNPNTQPDRRPEKPNRLRDFDYIVVNESASELMREIRLNFKNLAKYLDDKIPENRQKSVAFNNLEQACMWAIKAISHR